SSLSKLSVERRYVRRRHTRSRLTKGLVPFAYLDDLVRQESVRLPVHLLSGLSRRRIDETVHAAGVFVEPVLQVLDTVLLLHGKVHRVGPVTASAVRPSTLLVGVHESWHLTPPF